MPPKSKKPKKDLTFEEQIRLFARELGYRLVRLFSCPEWTTSGGQYDRLLARTRELLLADIEVIEALAAMEKTEVIPEVAQFIQARGYRCVHHREWEPLTTQRFSCVLCHSEFCAASVNVIDDSAFAIVERSGVGIVCRSCTSAAAPLEEKQDKDDVQQEEKMGIKRKVEMKKEVQEEELLDQNQRIPEKNVDSASRMDPALKIPTKKERQER
jgi:hypothetical protein